MCSLSHEHIADHRAGWHSGKLLNHNLEVPGHQLGRVFSWFFCVHIHRHENLNSRIVHMYYSKNEANSFLRLIT